MSGALRTELVVVEDLIPGDREAFLDELESLVSTIFINYGRDYLAKDMDAPHLASARVLMMRDEDGRLVGYNQVRRFAYDIDGRTVHMFRAMAGLLPECRGCGSTLNFGLAQAFRFKLAHPFTEVYFLPILLHPTSYALFARYGHAFWPTPKAPTPPDKFDLLKKLCETAGFPLDDPDYPYVCKPDVMTRQDDAEAADWAADPRPEVQFYLKTNPCYHVGQALVGIAPLTFANLFITGGKFAGIMLARRLGLAKRRR
jgi:hypothetical protein